jgi:proline iminopeptidase
MPGARDFPVHPPLTLGLLLRGSLGRATKGGQKPMRALIRDTEIYFDVDGPALVPDGSRMRERHTALLVHGGPGADHTGYKTTFAPLTRKLQLIYFDHRGQGRSARGDPTKYTLDENVEDMEALRKHLGLGPIVSIGASYGGMVAMAHAARYPSAVSHLILVVTAAHGGHIKRAREIVAQRGDLQQIALCDDLWAGRLKTEEGLRHFFEIMGPMYSRKHDPQRAKVALDRVIRSPEAQNQAVAPGGFQHTLDLRPQLAAITAPTLILGARHDWICSPEFSVELHELIRDSDLRIFEESGHAITADEPDELLDVITGFLVYNSKSRAGVLSERESS